MAACLSFVLLMWKMFCSFQQLFYVFFFFFFLENARGYSVETLLIFHSFYFILYLFWTGKYSYQFCTLQNCTGRPWTTKLNQKIYTWESNHVTCSSIVHLNLKQLKCKCTYLVVRGELVPLNGNKGSK